MADENTHDDGQDQTGVSSGDAGQDQPQYVTRQDLQEMRDAMFSMVRKMTQSTAEKAPEPKAQKQSGDSGVDDLRQQLQHMQLKTQFTELAADAGVTREQRNLLERLFMVERPDEPGKWLAEQVKLLGRVEAKAEPSTDGKGAPMSAPKSHPASDGGAPARGAGLDSAEPAWEMTQDDVDRLVREKGMYQAGVELRKRLKGDMRDRRFYIGRQR